MFDGASNEILLMIGGAFVFGWLLAKFGTFVNRRRTANSRDPRDDRIRSLEAEHRIAKSNEEKGRATIEAQEKELSEAGAALTETQESLAKQMEITVSLRQDLKDSVKKTRELRRELTDRATEGMRSEVKLREVETELEVSRASTDMIATGVLDYSMAPDADEDEPEVIKSIT